ncbi:MAG: silent information regulator protein Sir2 [Planctomycetia bacterium]|nr:silent information regulator protein Sir2 [Planctomycetia bacterium]
MLRLVAMFFLLTGSLLANDFADWTLRTTNLKGAMEWIPDGGPEGKGCLKLTLSPDVTQPPQEGKDVSYSWSLSSPIRERESREPYAWCQVQLRCDSGGLVFQLCNSEKGEGITRLTGAVLAVETTGWNVIGCKADFTSCEKYVERFSGNQPGVIFLQLPTRRWGAEITEKPKVEGFLTERPREKFTRELVAVPCEAGIYLGWRLFDTDAPDTAFELFRTENGTDWKHLNPEPITRTTDFVDRTVEKGKTYTWELRCGEEKCAVTQTVAEKEQDAKPYLSIRLPEKISFSRFGVGDLDGDGRFEFVLATPNFNTDPYHMPGYWKPSPEPYRLMAINWEGKKLWEISLTPSVETGIWYAPFLVADLDGDGKAEVVAKTAPGDLRNESGRVFSGEEFLTIFNGETGKAIAQIPWIPREDFTYNMSCRNMLALAFLDGKTPFLIVHRGTYSLQITRAYLFHDGKLTLAWEWDNRFGPQWGGGAHTLHAADVDGDGREEICMGSFVLDDNGTILWRTGIGHPDGMFVGEFLPSHPGMEIYLNVESRSDCNGMCMLDAATGKILWGHDKPTSHIHGQGLCADIDPRYPGSECYGGEHPRSPVQDRFFWTADGKLLGHSLDEKDFGLRGLSPQVAWWDADVQRELVSSNRPPIHYADRLPVGPKLEGNLLRVMDCVGDWREEVVTLVGDELRIYTTTVPAENRRPMLLQDANYRATVYESFMGYVQVPQLSTGL